MLFPEEDAPILKTWIVKRIEDTSDADSEVLAEYIIALLKHEGTKEEVRKLCEAEIPDFLTEDPAKFLDDVFRAIAYKSYVPGAPAPPSLTRAQNWYSTGQEQVGAQNGNQMAPMGREMAQSAQGATAEQFHPARQGNGMPPMSRKRGYRDLDAPLELSELSQNPRPTKNARRNGPEPAEHDPSLQYGQFPGFMQHLDLENPMAQQFRDMQMNMNMIMQSQWQNKGHGGHKKNKRQCRDFVTKGYCSRGASCNFEHGFDGGFLPNMGNVGEDYNPDDPSVILADSQAQFNPLPMQQPPFPQARGRGNKRTRGQRRKGGARASFSMEGPETDTSKSTIVVENIPEESFTEEEVRTFFSTFGSVTEVSLKPYKRLAIVKYDSWDAANAAYHSPKVVFDNRFVKVFWYRDESQILPPQHQAGGGAFRNGSHEAEPFDPEQFARKQEEAQKAYEEREAKRAEIDELKRELAEKQQDLLERHKAESSKLQSKLLSHNGSSTLDTNPLKAQLALLEQEAKMLGIDPDASPVDDDMSVSSWSTARGGWRGRSRGRGARRARGSFRGVGDRHAAYSRYSLDLRPRRVAISGVDFTESKKGELLRHFLLNISALDYSVDPTPSQTIVTLADRRTAEKLYTLLDGKQLPGIETDLQLEYLPNLPGSAPAKSDSTAPQLAGGGGGEGGGEGSGLGGGNGPPWPGSGDGGEVGWGMVINPDEDSASEEGEIEDTDMGGKQQAEDDDAY